MSTWKNRKTPLSKNFENNTQISEIKEGSSLLLIFKNQIKLTEPQNVKILPSTYPYNTKVSTANYSLDNNLTTSSFITQLSPNIPEVFDETTYLP